MDLLLIQIKMVKLLKIICIIIKINVMEKDVKYNKNIML